MACGHVRIFARTWTLGAFLIKSVVSPALIKTEHLRECSASRVLALYASAPNHVFGQMLGLPGSGVCPLAFRYYRLRWPKENYCDCALVIPDEHLSRESRKLAVMIQRETGQPLEDSSESIGFLHINEGPVYRSSTRTVSGCTRKYHGLYSRLTFQLLWLSESVTAI